MNKFIIIQTQFEGIHKYPQAPEEVSFLRSNHRHIFHVKAEIEVTHNDRELEFIMVKRDLDAHIFDTHVDLKAKSCEMIAEELIDYLSEKWPIGNIFNQGCDYARKIQVTVMEDNENGAIVNNC